MRPVFPAVSALALSVLLVAGCDRNARQPGEPQATAASTAPATVGDSMASDDSVARAQTAQDHPVMQAQVVLDRLGFTPGVVDGKTGLSTRNAIAGFQEANGLPQSGEMDAATREKLGQWSTIPATRKVTIPADFAAGPFMAMPKDPAEQAKLPALTYASLDEKLAERFHTTVPTLLALNPGVVAVPANAPPGSAAFRGGQEITVPNVGHDRIDPGQMSGDADWQRTLAMLGVGTDQPAVERVVVSKSKGTLKAYDKADKLVAVYTATMGSTHDPLPIGNWKVNGVSRNPKFHYNPALFWDASPGDKKAMLPPGPNSPVGVVWIDVSKEHYGIHGTPSPETIGRAESHGCVRLTNWDAARLSLMVKPGTKVVFEK